jgi:hypothetical protein
MDHVWAFESDPGVGGSGTGTAAAASTERRRETVAWRRGVRGGAEVAGGGCRAHLGRRRARSSPVGRRRPPWRRRASSVPNPSRHRRRCCRPRDLGPGRRRGEWMGGAACGGVVLSGDRCWWRAAAGGDDGWIWMVRPVVEMNG